MQKLSLAILAAVGLFVLALAGVLILRGRHAQTDTGDLPPTRADYRIKEVYLQEKSDNVVWKLTADQAEVFEREGRTVLRRVTIAIQQPDRSWTVTGEEGDLTDATKDVVIRKRVALISSDGIRLETDHLRWDAREKKVWTDAPVTLYRHGAVVTGQGLESRLAEEWTVVKGRVRAIFSRARSRPLPSPDAAPTEVR